MVPGGSAYVVETDEATQELLRVFVADPTVVWVDLEELAPSRLPGEEDYIGGAVVKIFGKVTSGPWRFPSSFSKQLGIAEVLSEGQQQPLETPRETYRKEAGRAVTFARERAGAELGFGVENIPKAGEVMASVGLEGVSSDFDLGRVLFIWGAYVGECLLEEFGGVWCVDPQEGELVELPRARLPSIRVYPFSAVEQTLRGHDASILVEWVDRVQGAMSSTEYALPTVR